MASGRGARRRLVPVLLAGTLGVLGCLPSGSATASPARTDGMQAPVPGTTCKVFPKANVWNTDISALPVHPKSAQWLATMHAGSTLLHPDFGKPPYGIPFAVVPDTHPFVPVDFLYDDESDPGPYPFGTDIPVENGSDKHALMVDQDTCVLYELYAVNWNNGNPKAGSGAIFDLHSNALRPDGWTSADAAGLSIFAGLVRWDEVQAGQIKHAIRLTAELTRNQHLWPARHDAGSSNASYPPMGARFRLKASYDLSGFSASAQVILTAMQHYGLLLADNGSDWYFTGAMDSHWPNALLDELKTVPAGQFEAVDESGLMVNADSGKAKQL